MAKTLLMGVLNVTPDSSYDKGKYFSFDAAIAHGKLLCEQGADLIDIGGESTWIESTPVSEAEELSRVMPVIERLSSELSIPLSIDTIKAGVAKAAVAAGVRYINDISGFRDPAMCRVAAECDAMLCIQHMQGTPQTMQNNPHYEEGIIPHLLHWVEERVAVLKGYGINEERMIFDPGIGFGKTVADNLQIIQNLPKLKGLGFPILLGVSRKNFMMRILNKGRDELLPPSIAMNTVACLAQVDMLRVHDVKEHRGVVDLMDVYVNSMRM